MCHVRGCHYNFYYFSILIYKEEDVQTFCVLRKKLCESSKCLVLVVWMLYKERNDRDFQRHTK